MASLLSIELCLSRFVLGLATGVDNCAVDFDRYRGARLGILSAQLRGVALYMSDAFSYSALTFLFGVVAILVVDAMENPV
jgi:hypothetical protein